MASRIADLWAPLRVALIEEKGREGASEWLTFASDVMKAEHAMQSRIRAEVIAQRVAAGTVGVTVSR